MAVTRGEGMVVEPFEATVMEVLADGMVRIAELPDMAIRVESVFDTETEVREAFAPREVETSAEDQTTEGAEVDQNGVPFVLSKDGTTTFGEISSDTGLSPASIKLSEGNSNYGRRHLEERHGEQIRNAGFASVEDFVWYVAHNYDRANVKRGVVRPDGSETYFIQIVDNHANTLFIELSRDGSYWNVNSGGVFRANYGENKENVLSASEAQNGESVPDNTLQPATKADNNAGSNGTVSDVSGGEVSDISSDMQAVPLDLSGVAVGDVIHYGAGGYSGSYEVTRIDAEGTVWIRNVKGGEEQAVSEEDSSDFYGSLDDAIDVATGVKAKAESEVGDPHPASGTPPISQSETELHPRSWTKKEQHPSAFERVPKDEQGNPLYEQADTDTAWDAIVEQTEGDEVMAQTVADGMVADKEAALKKIEKAKAKGGVSIAEKIAAEKERKAAIDIAKQELDIWKKIAGTSNRRKMEAEAERRRIADEAAALRKAEEERLRAEREEAERIEREALNGVPDMVDDTPQDARARGYRRVSGHKIDRQEPVQGLQGKEIAVKFSDNTIPTGRVAVIEAEQLQPSHIGGQRNPLHFIDEAQPKERNDEASVLSARKIAGNIRPEEITSSVTAYTGAPTVNARGEAIQGNSRSDALRQMWESHPEQSAKYKQYLTDHAQEFGLNAEDIASMQHPVLVNMLDVEDDDAITLGQYVAQDTESGGTERIKPKNALQRMGADIRTFANLLLKSTDEETSFAGLVDNNGATVLEWMSQRGFITPTQYKSAFDSKGNLTAEAKNDLRGIMYQSIFKGGSTRLEEMFNAMPAKAQKAILATAFRDFDSPSTERMIEEIQNSIRAFYALSQDAAFDQAKTFKKARMAAEGWKIQYQIDDVTGESYLPAGNFSNFALLLATMYKGENQSIIQGTFNKLYDLIQGTQEENLFEQPDNTPRTLAQAIYETLNITYNGQRRSNVLVGDSSASQRGQQGSTGDAATGERVEDGERTADSAGRTDGDSRGSLEGENRGNQGEETETPQNVTVHLTADEAQDFIADMELSADVAPEIDLTIENWVALFGESGTVNTPIGEVKMGENQFAKLMRQGREGELGMIKPTLENPHAIVEEASEAKEGDTTERASSYIFIRSFKKADGSRFYYFTSITVSKDGKEVVVSSQEKSRNKILRLLQEGNVIWRTPKDTTTSSAERQGLDYEQPNKAETAAKGSGITPQSTPSDSKDTTNSPTTNELGEKNTVPSVQKQVQAAEAGGVSDKIPEMEGGKAQASTAKKPINNLSELRAKALERGADPEWLDRYERMPLTVLRKQAKIYEETLRKVSPALGTRLQAEHDYVRALIAEQERNKKYNKWGVKVGNTATPFEKVRAMFEEWNSDADVAALMDKVAPIFEKLPVKIMFSDTIGGSSAQGSYNAAKGELKLAGHFVYSELMSNQPKAQGILHEMIHAVTSYALYVDEMPALQSVIGMSLSPEMRKAVDTLRLIFSRIKTDPAFRGEYGSTDVHEMVAELSNPGFRAKLREKGLWQQVVDAIKRLLGIEVKNALDGAEGALQKMLDNFDRTQWDKLVAVGRKHASMADGLVDRMFIGEQGASELDSSEMVTEEVNITPLLNVVKTLYEKGKEFASKLFQRRYFDVAITPDFMKRLGLRGDKFTVKYGVIARHIGKDGSHDLSEKDWERLPQALQTPFAITKLNDKKDSYRIYTTLRTEKGEYVVVGVDVKNAGRELEVNAISTVFGRRNNANLSANEEVIYKDKNITPNQSSLLERPNLAQYPINQELPADKVSDNFSDTQEGMSDVLARPGDRYDYQRGGKITANNVNTALYVESGDYMSELRGVNGISLRVRQEGGLEIDADKLKAELDRALPILEEYRDTLTSLKSRATISAQSVIDNQIAEIEDTIAWSYRVKDNPDLIKESYRPALLSRPGDSLAAVNERFNEELDGLTEENARGVIFDLGMPSEILTSCGIENKPIRLYGAKVVAKAKKHGYNPSDLRNLPMAINAPIAVFSGSQAGSYAILTEIEISGKNVLVSIMVGKGGHDVDFNIITSAYGKNSDSITRWINEGKLLYADKTKTLDYLSVPAPIAGAQVNQELDDAAKIVENFENPTIGQENNAEIGGNVQTFADVAVAAGEKLGVKVVVDPTMGSKGSYNLSTGEVRVNPNAHLTEADVERTVVHEVIGHGGMQALLGERFDEICANVYAHMSEEQRADIRRRHGKGLSNAEVGAEYMAETAERMASGEQVTSKLRQLWERVKGWIRDAARRRGIAVAMSDADIRYMIATASRKAREGKLQEMIDHAVETRRLRGAAMSQDAMESQLSQPLMRPRDSEDASQLASGVAGLTDAEYVQQMQLEEVARRVAGRWGGQNKKNRRVRLRTNMIDASHPIHKVLQQMYGLATLDDVEKTLGYGERNAYMMRERAASRAADRVLVFRRQVLAPLNSMRTDFVKALAEEFGIKLSEALALSKVYFAAKTGLERQRVKEETAEDGAEDRDYAGLGGSMIWLGALLRHWNGAELPPIDWVAEAERRGYKDTKTKGWKKGPSAVARLTENRAAVEEILAAHGYPTLEEWVEYVDGLSIEAAAAKGDIGMSRFGTADMWSIIQGVSRTMLEGQVKAGLLSAEGYQRLAFGDTFANIIWRKELAAFFSGTHHGVLHLGATSPVLMACGLNPQTLYITSKTLRTHVNKHGLTADDLMDLPEALRNPLMVYEWGTKAKSLVIITELQRGRQRITVAVKLERGGEILEVNEVASVHGKDASRFLDDMKNAHAGGFAVALRWVSDKKDVLHWLGIAPPKGAAPQTDEELIAKVITDFTNPDLTSVKLPKNGISYWTDSRQLVENGYMTEEVASKKTA